MNIRRLAALVVAVPLVFVTTGAGAQSHMGAGHGGGHFAGSAHFHGAGGGFRHGGHFRHGFHGGHLGGVVIAGGLWYPWYAYGAPAYAAPAYANAWYCQSAAAYYPAVVSCPEGWVLVEPPAPMLP